MSEEFVLSDELRELAVKGFQSVPYHKDIGLELLELDAKHVAAKLPMKDSLVGNPFQKILHGGVISAVLDSTGGLMAGFGAYARMQDLPAEERFEVLAKLGTIDMRIDFLRPGKPGKDGYFIATASLLRAGNKVAVTRMEFANDEGVVLAVGTGTYLCG